MENSTLSISHIQTAFQMRGLAIQSDAVIAIQRALKQ